MEKYAKQISKGTTYPIKNFGQLTKALGGEDAPVEFEGWRAPAKRLKEFIPDRFFPVESEQDLLNKAEDLRARHGAAPPDRGDAAPQPEEEMPEELRSDFAEFRRRGFDPSRAAPPKETEAQAGVAQLPQS